MPGRDGTGPRGVGPMTGRGAGYCAGYANSLPGRGYGMGFGRGVWGRGAGLGGHARRNMFYASGPEGLLREGQPGWMRFGGNAAPFAGPDPEMTKQVLKNQADYLQGELDEIRKRLDEMEKEEGEK